MPALDVNALIWLNSTKYLLNSTYICQSLFIFFNVFLPVWLLNNLIDNKFVMEPKEVYDILQLKLSEN